MSKGKSYGKGWNQGFGKGGYANYVGNEYAPNPIPVQQQAQSAYPQLMATPWNPSFVGSLCTVSTRNKYEALSTDDDEFPDISETIDSARIRGEKKIVQIRKPDARDRAERARLLEDKDTME